MALKEKVIPMKKIKALPVNSNPKTVADLKKKYRHLPLHFLFGIEKEIDYQCPSLDIYMDQLFETKISLEKIRRCKTLNSAQIHAATGLHNITNLSKDIDEITRQNFEKLRLMAEGWKQLALAAINETKNPEKFLKI